MHGELEHTPTAFYRSNIACIHVLLNLVTILIISKTSSGAVMTFEDILGNVLDQIPGDAYFNINMTIVSKQ